MLHSSCSKSAVEMNYSKNNFASYFRLKTKKAKVCLCFFLFTYILAYPQYLVVDSSHQPRSDFDVELGVELVIVMDAAESG